MKPLILSISILDPLGYIDRRPNKKTKDKNSCADIEFSAVVTQDNITRTNMKLLI